MHLKKIEQLEKEIKNYTFNADGSVTVEFTNKSVNAKKEDIEPYMPMDKYRLATIIYLYY
ncbi:hypothetical protein ACV3X1_14980 [Clostridium perfringens]